MKRETIYWVEIFIGSTGERWLYGKMTLRDAVHAVTLVMTNFNEVMEPDGEWSVRAGIIWGSPDRAKYDRVITEWEAEPWFTPLRDLRDSYTKISD